MIEIELKLPMPGLQLQLIVDQTSHELRRQPALDLVANLGFGPTRFGFTQIHGQAPQILQNLAGAGRHTLELFARERSRVLHHTEVFFAVHQHLFARRTHAGLLAAASGKLFDRPLT